MGVDEVSGHGKRAVFLDRDGVLNAVVVRDGLSFPPSSCAELSILQGVEKALDLLKEAGFLLIAVTNQPDVARAAQSKRAVEEIHAKLLSLLPLDEIFTCYHDDRDTCQCRKPQPGLLLQAAEKYSIPLCDSFIVGDRWKDIEAGYRAGCKTVWVDSGYREPQPIHPPDLSVRSLMEAVPWILRQAGRGDGIR